MGGAWHRPLTLRKYSVVGMFRSPRSPPLRAVSSQTSSGRRPDTNSPSPDRARGRGSRGDARSPSARSAPGWPERRPGRAGGGGVAGSGAEGSRAHLAGGSRSRPGASRGASTGSWRARRRPAVRPAGCAARRGAEDRPRSRLPSAPRGPGGRAGADASSRTRHRRRVARRTGPGRAPRRRGGPRRGPACAGRCGGGAGARWGGGRGRGRVLRSGPGSWAASRSRSCSRSGSDRRESPARGRFTCPLALACFSRRRSSAALSTSPVVAPGMECERPSLGGVEHLQELAVHRDVEAAEVSGERFDVVAALHVPRGVGQSRFVRTNRFRIGARPSVEHRGRLGWMGGHSSRGPARLADSDRLPELAGSPGPELAAIPSGRWRP